MKITNVTVDLPTDLTDFLLAQAAREKISPAQLLCRAIRLERFIIKQEMANRKILLETPDRKFFKVDRH